MSRCTEDSQNTNLKLFVRKSLKSIKRLREWEALKRNGVRDVPFLWNAAQPQPANYFHCSYVKILIVVCYLTQILRLCLQMEPTSRLKNTSTFGKSRVFGQRKVCCLNLSKTNCHSSTVVFWPKEFVKVWSKSVQKVVR